MTKNLLKILPFILGTIAFGTDNEKRLAATEGSGCHFSTELAEAVAAQAEEVFAKREIIRKQEQILQNARVIHQYLTGEQEFLHNYHRNGLATGEATLAQVETLQGVIAQAEAVIQEENLVIEQNNNDITAANEVIQQHQAKLDSQPYGWYKIGYTNEQNEERQIWQSIIATQRDIIATANQNIANARRNINNTQYGMPQVTLGNQVINANLGSLRLHLEIMNGEDPVQARRDLAIRDLELAQNELNHYQELMNINNSIEEAQERIQQYEENRQEQIARHNQNDTTEDEDEGPTLGNFLSAIGDGIATAQYAQGIYNLPSLQREWNNANITVEQLQEQYNRWTQEVNRLKNLRDQYNHQIDHYNRYEGGQLNIHQEEELARAASEMEHLPQQIAQLNEKYHDLTIYQQGGIDELREQNMVVEELINILALRPGQQLNSVTINDLAGFQHLLTQNFYHPESGFFGTVGGLLESVLYSWR